MGFARDLAWQELDLVHRSSVSHQFARYALRLSYDLLPQDVVHEAKRCVLDALGCAIGAFDAPGRSICEEAARDLGGPVEATVIGSGMRTSALNATLANCFMVRFLDYNDIGGGGHNSDAIPALLAVAEREKRGGRDLLTSTVVSYELGDRFAVSYSAPNADAKEKTGTYKAMFDTGWKHDIRGGLNMPPSLGRLMGLTEEQIVAAIGMVACSNLPMGILDADREEYVMMKNLRFGWVAHAAILACTMAKRGFTGPVRIVEGDYGWRQVLFQGGLDLEKIVDFSGWQILNTRHKSVPMNGTTSGHVLATLALVTENDLKPADIASVRIRTSRKEARHTTTFAKKYPRNAESADHSSFYLNALAIKERAVGPDSIDPKKFDDPVILDLIEKITVEGDEDRHASHFGGTSRIVTTDGRVFEKAVTTPHGLGDDPMSDKDLEDKFAEMAEKYMGKGQIRQVFDAIWNLERLDSIAKLMELVTFKSPRGRA